MDISTSNRARTRGFNESNVDPAAFFCFISVRKVRFTREKYGRRKRTFFSAIIFFRDMVFRWRISGLSLERGPRQEAAHLAVQGISPKEKTSSQVHVGPSPARRARSRVRLCQAQAVYRGSTARALRGTRVVGRSRCSFLLAREALMCHATPRALSLSPSLLAFVSLYIQRVFRELPGAKRFSSKFMNFERVRVREYDWHCRILRAPRSSRVAVSSIYRRTSSRSFFNRDYLKWRWQDTFVESYICFGHPWAWLIRETADSVIEYFLSWICEI